MSCFVGRMQEYDRVSLDRFDGKNLQSTVYFLSHLHEDHTVGLGEKLFFKRLKSNKDIFLYCSEVTQVLLAASKKYQHLVPHIKTLGINSPTILVIPDPLYEEKDQITVTLLPAFHCPGSVMFLIEGKEGTVLYTGDFRWEHFHIEQMHHLRSGERYTHLSTNIAPSEPQAREPPKNNFAKPTGSHVPSMHARLKLDSVKQIKSLYVDTTFCTPENLHIPSRQQCIDAVYELVHEWTARSPKHIVNIHLRAQYGHEPLLNAVATRLHKKVHVNEHKVSVYNNIVEFHDNFTTDGINTQLHACDKNCMIDVDGERVLCREVHDADKVLAILPTTMYFTQFQRLTLDKIVKKINDNFFRACYSFHSSYTEVKDLLSYLKPERVFPNVKPPGDSSLAETQHRLNVMLTECRAHGAGEEIPAEEEVKELGALKTRSGRVVRKRKGRESLSDSESLDFGSPAKVVRKSLSSSLEIEEPTVASGSTTRGSRRGCGRGRGWGMAVMETVSQPVVGTRRSSRRSATEPVVEESTPKKVKKCEQSPSPDLFLTPVSDTSDQHSSFLGSERSDSELSLLSNQRSLDLPASGESVTSWTAGSFLAAVSSSSLDDASAGCICLLEDEEENDDQYVDESQITDEEEEEIGLSLQQLNTMTHPDITQDDSDVTQKSSPTKSSKDKAKSPVKRGKRGRKNTVNIAHDQSVDEEINIEQTKGLGMDISCVHRVESKETEQWKSDNQCTTETVQNLLESPQIGKRRKGQRRQYQAPANEHLTESKGAKFESSATDQREAGKQIEQSDTRVRSEVEKNVSAVTGSLQETDATIESTKHFSEDTRIHMEDSSEGTKTESENLSTNITQLDDTRKLKYLDSASETVCATELTKSNLNVENIYEHSDESGSTSNEACIRISNNVVEKIDLTKITESTSKDPCVTKSDKGVKELENKTTEIGSSRREPCFTKSNNVVEGIENKTMDTDSSSKESIGTLCYKLVEEREKNKDSSHGKDGKTFESSDSSSTSKENSEELSVPSDGVLQLHLSESTNDSEHNSCESKDLSQYATIDEIVIIDSDVDSTDSLNETNDNVRIAADMNSAKLESVQHEDSAMTNAITFADNDSSEVKDSDDNDDYTDKNSDAQTHHCLGSERNEDDVKKDAIILIDSDSNEVDYNRIGKVNDGFSDTYSEKQKDNYSSESEKSETEVLKKDTIMIVDTDSIEVEDHDDKITDNIKVKCVDLNSGQQKVEIENVHGNFSGENFSRSSIYNREGNGVGVQSCEDIPEKFVDPEKAEELDKQSAAEQISNPEDPIRHDVPDDNGISAADSTTEFIDLYDNCEAEPMSVANNGDCQLYDIAYDTELKKETKDKEDTKYPDHEVQDIENEYKDKRIFGVGEESTTSPEKYKHVTECEIIKEVQSDDKAVPSLEEDDDVIEIVDLTGDDLGGPYLLQEQPKSGKKTIKISLLRKQEPLRNVRRQAERQPSENIEKDDEEENDNGSDLEDINEISSSPEWLSVKKASGYKGKHSSRKVMKSRTTKTSKAKNSVDDTSEFEKSSKTSSTDGISVDNSVGLSKEELEERAEVKRQAMGFVCETDSETDTDESSAPGSPAANILYDEYVELSSDSDNEGGIGGNVKGGKSSGRKSTNSRETVGGGSGYSGSKSSSSTQGWLNSRKNTDETVPPQIQDTNLSADVDLQHVQTRGENRVYDTLNTHDISTSDDRVIDIVLSNKPHSSPTKVLLPRTEDQVYDKPRTVDQIFNMPGTNPSKDEDLQARTEKLASDKSDTSLYKDTDIQTRGENQVSDQPDTSPSSDKDSQTKGENQASHKLDTSPSYDKDSQTEGENQVSDKPDTSPRDKDLQAKGENQASHKPDTSPSSDTDLQTKTEDKPSGKQGVASIQEPSMLDVPTIQTAVDLPETNVSESRAVENPISQSSDVPALTKINLGDDSEPSESLMKSDCVKFQSSQTDGANLQSSQTDDAKLQSSQTDGTKLQSLQTDDAKLQSSQSDGAKLQSSQTDGAKLQSSQNDNSKLQSSEKHGAKPQTPQKDAAARTDIFYGSLYVNQPAPPGTEETVIPVIQTSSPVSVPNPLYNLLVAGSTVSAQVQPTSQTVPFLPYQYPTSGHPAMLNYPPTWSPQYPYNNSLPPSVHVTRPDMTLPPPTVIPNLTQPPPISKPSFNTIPTVVQPTVTMPKSKKLKPWQQKKANLFDRGPRSEAKKLATWQQKKANLFERVPRLEANKEINTVTKIPINLQKPPSKQNFDVGIARLSQQSFQQGSSSTDMSAIRANIAALTGISVKSSPVLKKPAEVNSSEGEDLAGMLIQLKKLQDVQAIMEAINSAPAAENESSIETYQYNHSKHVEYDDHVRDNHYNRREVKHDRRQTVDEYELALKRTNSEYERKDRCAIDYDGRDRGNVDYDRLDRATDHERREREYEMRYREEENYERWVEDRKRQDHHRWAGRMPPLHRPDDHVEPHYVRPRHPGSQEWPERYDGPPRRPQSPYDRPMSHSPYDRPSPRIASEMRRSYERKDLSYGREEYEKTVPDVYGNWPEPYHGQPYSEPTIPQVSQYAHVERVPAHSPVVGQSYQKAHKVPPVSTPKQVVQRVFSRSGQLLLSSSYQSAAKAVQQTDCPAVAERPCDQPVFHSGIAKHQ